MLDNQPINPKGSFELESHSKVVDKSVVESTSVDGSSEDVEGSSYKEFVVDASRRRGRLIGNNIGFKSFKRGLGQSFTCRDSYKNVAAKYRILQGRMCQ